MEPGNRYERAMAIETQAEADAYFEQLVQLSVGAGLERADAERTERGNLGYVAGYYGNEVRARVERLFRCEHPIFGAIAVNGPPTPEQAFAAGVALGKAARERAL